jgi:hypothetical protein
MERDRPRIERELQLLEAQEWSEKLDEEFGPQIRPDALDILDSRPSVYSRRPDAVESPGLPRPSLLCNDKWCVSAAAATAYGVSRPSEHVGDCLRVPAPASAERRVLKSAAHARANSAQWWRAIDLRAP